MTQPNYVADPNFIAKRRQIFIMFLGREGVAASHAEEELNRLESVGGEQTRYLRLQRTGSRYPMTRDRKIDFALLYDNAGNHASYEYELPRDQAA